ncbi:MULTISPECIES: hypothetical protein [unclassified Caballeronia]|uniref:hypothetical protein n=1 Tax=unclassified Caballeronia TaxID=2646786 RepID=UPI0028554CEA|nr:MULTISPECIES: hypothetical protein [unclassified Caballeronia]MDR5749898.1 hypothetical protein [Caballeronia sp. LZ024]MDR5842974.1 hypothetical protein [Caballeronia sp. LZ031]
MVLLIRTVRWEQMRIAIPCSMCVSTQVNNYSPLGDITSTMVSRYRYKYGVNVKVLLQRVTGGARAVQRQAPQRGVAARKAHKVPACCRESGKPVDFDFAGADFTNGHAHI